MMTGAELFFVAKALCAVWMGYLWASNTHEKRMNRTTLVVPRIPAREYLTPNDEAQIERYFRLFYGQYAKESDPLTWFGGRKPIHTNNRGTF